MQKLRLHVLCITIAQGCRPFLADIGWRTQDSTCYSSKKPQKIPFPSNYKLSNTTSVCSCGPIVEQRKSELVDRNGIPLYETEPTEPTEFPSFSLNDEGWGTEFEVDLLPNVPEDILDGIDYPRARRSDAETGGLPYSRCDTSETVKEGQQCTKDPPTSLFTEDEESFCKLSLSFAERAVFREKRYAKVHKYRITPDIVEKAMIWRRKVSIAQLMMYHVDNTRRSSLFDDVSIRYRLNEVMSHADSTTRVKLDALEHAGTVLRGHNEPLGFDQFRLWATLLMDCLTEVVFNAADNVHVFNESTAELVTEIEGHMELLLSWSIDYPVTVCHLSTNERVNIQTGVKVYTIEVELSPSDCSLSTVLLDGMYNYLN